MLHRPVMSFSSPDGVHDVQHVLYVSDGRGKSAPVVSVDGMLWFRTGDDAEGCFLRTTLRGEIVDTLYAPYQILHADKRISVASGPFPEGEEAPLVIVRQKAADTRRKAIPPSPLGRCNSLMTY